MKVLIVEDELYAYERLVFLLCNHDKSLQVSPQVSSIRQAVEVLRRDKYDLILMDVQLADGICFSIFEQIEIMTPVIFTTAYDHYAIRAFKVNSIDYLLKPIRKEDLLAAIEKFGNLRQNFAGFGIASESFNKKTFKNRFVVKVGDFIKIILIDEISCFYSLEKGTFLQTISDNNYLIDYSLDQLSGVLDPALFFRVNRKYLVKVDQIKDIVAWSNSRLRINLITPTDDQIVVARERVKDFKHWLGYEK